MAATGAEGETTVLDDGGYIEGAEVVVVCVMLLARRCGPGG